MRALISILLIGVCLASARAATVSGRVTLRGRPAADGEVYLDGHLTPTPNARAVLYQKDMRGSPHVLAVTAGTTVDYHNHDNVFHNVFSYYNGKRFDLGLYPKGRSKSLRFDKPGLSEVYCNIHPDMGAYILVV